jgi:hypothetical protein
MDTNELYNKCWDKWGTQLQIDILIEEMAELTHALLKARRNGDTIDMRVMEELQDVKICIGQLDAQIDKAGLALVARDYREMKLERLEERVGK